MNSNGRAKQRGANRSPSPKMIVDEEIGVEEATTIQNERDYGKERINRKKAQEKDNYNNDDEEEEYDQYDFDNEIAEEIEDTLENESDLYLKMVPQSKKNNFNERIYSGQPERMQPSGLQNDKKRPISAVIDDRKLKFNLSEQSRTQNDYRSVTESGESNNNRDDGMVKFSNEQTKLLNSNPFKRNLNINDGLDVNVPATTTAAGTSSQQSIVPTQQKKTKIVSYSQPFNEERERVSRFDNHRHSPAEKKQDGLEKLFMKISKMNDGERDELEVLIDKIDTGELSVQALKSLLFMKNSKSEGQSNSAALDSQRDSVAVSQSSAVSSTSKFNSNNADRKPNLSTNLAKRNNSTNEIIQKKSTQNHQSINDLLHPSVSVVQNTNSGLYDLELQSEKPETIRFSTLMKNQIAGSISQGLFENTQALEATLNAQPSVNSIAKVSNLESKNTNSKSVSIRDDNNHHLKGVSPRKNGSPQKQSYVEKRKNSLIDLNHGGRGFDGRRQGDYQENDQNYNSDDDQQGKMCADDDDDDNDEDNSDDERPVGGKSKPIKKQFKDTLQLRREKEQLVQIESTPKQRFVVVDTSSNPIQSTTSQSSSTTNRTYNLSKNRDKSAGSSSISIRELKEQKGEVFLIIRVLSTWGSVHLAGLTELKIYDERGIGIELKSENFMIEGGSSTSLRNIHRICDGVFDTMNSDHMWLGTMPDPPKCLEIGINFKSAHGLGAIKIWNFNKSLIDSTKGIKEIQITRNNKLIYEGIVRQALGKEHENYAHVIRIKPDISLQDDEKPALKHNSSKPSNYNAHAQSNFKTSETDSSTNVLITTNSNSSMNSNLKQTGVSTPRTKAGTATTTTTVSSSISQLKKPANLPVGGSSGGNNGTTSTPSSRVRSAVNNQASKIRDESDLRISETNNATTIAAGQSSVSSKVRNSITEGSGGNDDILSMAVQQAQQQTRIHRKWGHPTEQQATGSSNHSMDLKSISATVPVASAALTETVQESRIRNSIRGTGEKDTIGIQSSHASTSSLPKRGPKVLANIFDEKQIPSKQLPQGASNTNINKQNSFGRGVIAVSETGFENTHKNNNEQPDENSNNVAATDDREWMMEKVRLFNATHQGRFGAAERERVLQKQADDVKESVQQALKSINPLLLPQSSNAAGLNILGVTSQSKPNNVGGVPILDAKQHFGFEDSDDYNALDMFLDYKGKSQQGNKGGNSGNTSTSNAQKNTVTPLNNSTTTAASNEGQQQQQQVKIKSKNILEETIIADLLREENSTIQGDVFAPRPISAQKSVNNVKQTVIVGQKTTPVTISAQSDQNTSIDIMELLRSQKVNVSDLNESNFLNQLRSAEILSSIIPSSITSLPADKKVKQANLSTNESRMFQIPNLPEGKVIRLEISSTWGDSHYVGLSGIEFFSAEGGESIRILQPKVSVKAAPSDINVLPEYGQDPRTCDKLVDGTYLTCDDLHMWLAPFTQGQRNIVSISLPQRTRLAMIRIWNYNKSRIHSSRGVRDLTIFFDETPIFAGQITKAPGNQTDAASQCEYIMFTSSDSLLDRIEAQDWLNTYELPQIEEEQMIKDQLLATQTLMRPKTGQKNGSSSSSSQGIQNDELRESLTGLPRSLIGKDGRPITSAKISKAALTMLNNEDVEKRISEKLVTTQPKSVKGNSKKRGIRCKKLRINLLKGSEDRYYIGLTGIELYDEDGVKIALSSVQLEAEPKDSGKTLDKLIDGVNVTTNEKHMWIAQLLDSGENHITINLQQERVISGIKIWNYNKFIAHDNSKVSEAYRGARMISIVADDRIPITPLSGITIRRAPGKDYFDFGQMIPLPFEAGWTHEILDSLKFPQQVANQIVQEYDTIYLPRGFCFKFHLHSTWGDAHYIGLNGIEFYDSLGREIISSGSGGSVKIGAEPSSVNMIKGNGGSDIRTVDKLLNGENSTYDDRNMWLAPFIDQHRNDSNLLLGQNPDTAAKMNTLFVLFEKPVIISAINFWNYSKTPSRGVREVEIFCDDKLIFRGYLKQAPSKQEHQQSQIPLASTVVFNRNPQVLKKITPVAVYNEDKLHQRVFFFNEGKIDENFCKEGEESKQAGYYDPFERPTTKVSSMRN